MSKDNVIDFDFRKAKKSGFWTTDNINYDLTSYNISFEGIDNLDSVVTVNVPSYFDWTNNTILTNTGSITVTFDEDENK